MNIKINGIKVESQLLAYLMENYLLTAYIEELLKTSPPHNSYVGDIDSSFSWVGTEQGHEFWSEHQDDYVSELGGLPDIDITDVIHYLNERDSNLVQYLDDYVISTESIDVLQQEII